VGSVKGAKRGAGRLSRKKENLQKSRTNGLLADRRGKSLSQSLKKGKSEVSLDDNLKEFGNRLNCKSSTSTSGHRTQRPSTIETLWREDPGKAQS